jgi:CheY-like chemotaxis protein
MKPPSSILIVDDDSVVRFLMMRVIKKVSQQQPILTASNGEEALAVLNQVCATDVCPELILLDINMPLMDGFEFLNALQTSSLAALPFKIVMLTSSVNPRDVERAQTYPIEGYLQKPLTEDKLKSIIAA